MKLTKEIRIRRKMFENGHKLVDALYRLEKETLIKYELLIQERSILTDEVLMQGDVLNKLENTQKNTPTFGFRLNE